MINTRQTDRVPYSEYISMRIRVDQKWIKVENRMHYTFKRGTVKDCFIHMNKKAYR